MKEKKSLKGNITQILVWLKVNNIAYFSFEAFTVKEPGKEPVEQKYYDFISGKFYSKNEIIELAKSRGYKEEER